MGLGPLMVDVQGEVLTQEEKDLLLSPAVGGVILFARNYHDREQVQALVEEIHALRHPRLLVAVDQEGGRVQRFRERFVALPCMHALGDLYDHDAEEGIESAHSCGWLMATELRQVGVDFSFAPILDLDFGICSVIGDRSFHKDVDVVTMLASSFVRGMREAGMEAVGKHFPGHGGVVEDSHIEFPIDQREMRDLQMADLVPFARMIEHGLPGLMSAHVVYNKMDNLPASFSSFWLTKVLREQLGFQGALFSDDLTMRAATVIGDIEQRVQSALSAGSDMALICNAPEDARRAVHSKMDYVSPTSEIRLTRFHGKNPAYEQSEYEARWATSLERVRNLTSEDSGQLQFD